MVAKTKRGTTRVDPAGNNESLMVLDNVQVIARLIEETVISVDLRAPSAEVIQLVRDGDTVIEEANALTIGDDADYKLADLSWTSMKNDSERLDKIRQESNAPMLKLKGANDALLKPGVDNRLLAVAIIQAKMRAYDSAKKQEGAQTQLAQAKLSEQHRLKLLEEAAEIEERARKSKSQGKQVQLTREAEELRRTATIMPEQFAAPSSSVPQTAGSGKAILWRGRVTDARKFMEWMLGVEPGTSDQKTDDRLAYATFAQGLLNNLAKQTGPQGLAVPGFEAYDHNSYRRSSK